MASSPSKSGDRAFDFLELVVNADTPIGLTEIADVSGTNLATAHRTMALLESRGYVKRDTSTKRYSPGRALVALAARVLAGLDLQTTAQATMRRIRELTSETLSLHVPVGTDRVCVAALESYNTLRRVVPLGDRLPVYAGPTGKVMLAYLPDAEVTAALDRAAEDGVDMESLRRHIAEARENGFLCLVGDRSPGIGGLSVPVFERGVLAAALTVSGPADRWDQASMLQHAPGVVAEVAALSKELGCLVNPSANP